MRAEFCNCKFNESWAGHGKCKFNENWALCMWNIMRAEQWESKFMRYGTEIYISKSNKKLPLFIINTPKLHKNYCDEHAYITGNWMCLMILWIWEQLICLVVFKNICIWWEVYTYCLKTVTHCEKQYCHSARHTSRMMLFRKGKESLSCLVKTLPFF